jgi:hypothetical protein
MEDIENTDNEFVKEISEVFRKHGFVAFVYSAVKDRNADQWVVDTTVCIDDDQVPPHLQEDCIDTMMTDLVNIAHEAVHDIQDSRKTPTVTH